MARPATGSVVETRGPNGTTYALRFRALGHRQYVTLGSTATGWDRARAEAELANVLADVRRGVWQPPAPAQAVETAEAVTFHEFASQWLASREREVAPATYFAYRNELVRHLLPFFADHLLAHITVAEVDRYREAKLREGTLSHRYINATITRLGAILDVADERDLLVRNPVRVNARRRKLRVSNVQRAYLDRPEQIARLLDAADALDALAGRRRDRDTCLRRPLLATLVFAGLRIGEALALRWRDVDLAGGRLRVEALPDPRETPEQARRRRGAKTDAGVRWVPLMPVLRDELLRRKVYVAATGPDAFVFATSAGRPWSRDNARNRVLRPAHDLADMMLDGDDLVPLPARLTLHSLRHTYVSLRVALGDDLAAISRDAGHADVSITSRIYTHVMSLGQGDRERLRTLCDGGRLGSSGQNPPQKDPHMIASGVPENDETPVSTGVSTGTWGVTRTPDLTIMSRTL
jgi:integrase